MTLNRRILCFAAILALASLVGCSGDDRGKPKEYVYVGTQRVTGFYIGQSDGGHISIVVDRYAEKGASSPASLMAPRPPNVRAVMTPDNGSAPIQLTGYEANGHLYCSGGGYSIDAPTNDFKFPFYALYGGPNGPGYFHAYVSSSESVGVFLGSFTGDSLAGRWHFVVRDSTSSPDSSTATIEGIAIDAQRGSFMSIEGTITPDGSTYSIVLDGGISGPSALRWGGYGVMDGGGASATGTWQIQDALDQGTWSATRFVPPIP